MMKRITIVAFLITLIVSFGGGLLVNKQNTKIGKIDYSNKLVVAKEDGTVTNSPINGNGNVVYSSPPQDAIPGLDNYMDYQTNGNSLQAILVNHDTIIVAVAYCDSLDGPNANGGSTMRSRYNFSYNSGTSWEVSTGIDFSLDRKTRYPDLFNFVAGSLSSVGMAGRIFLTPVSSSSRGGGTAKDLALGVGNPDVYLIDGTGVTGNSDAFSHSRIDGKIGLVYSPNSTDSIVYITWDPNTGNFTGKKYLYSDSRLTGTNATVSSYTIGASRSANHMTIAYIFINEPISAGDNYRSVRYQTSTDNGVTWTNPPLKFGLSTTHPNVIGGDSCQVYWHEDIAYKPGTSTPYIVFSTYPYVWDPATPTTNHIAVEENKGWKICIQSTAINGGTDPVVIADWHNITILGDTSLYNQIVNFQVNSALLSHPSVGFSQDGSTIWVAYSVIQIEHCVGYLQEFNYFDVYVQKSTDGGLTWSTPQNVSNTTNEDEMYPDVAEVNNKNNYPYLIYQWNAIPGCHAFTNNQTVGICYEIFKSTVIGVKNISSEVPASFSLKQNYPNPFNPTTKIRFDISKTSNVTLKVYNINGQEVAVLLNNENINPGTKEVEFDGVNLASGVYFYTLRTGDFNATKKMILIK
jgi:Secretion system C-terminal sorting domain